MVKCHKNSGAPRHFRSNQRKYAIMKNGIADVGTCNTCAHRGRAGGDRKRGYSQGQACFNKKSKMYMRLVWNRTSCSLYELSRKG